MLVSFSRIGMLSFQQIQDPSLPLTNNKPERSLRCWVITRRLNYGTKTEEGTLSM